MRRVGKKYKNPLVVRFCGKSGHQLPALWAGLGNFWRVPLFWAEIVRLVRYHYINHTFTWRSKIWRAVQASKA